MVAPIADCRLALRTLLAPFGPAALTNGGSLGAARLCGTWSSSDPEGSRIGMRVVLAIPRIWRITGPLARSSVTCAVFSIGRFALKYDSATWARH